jgi:protein subunit release factor A
MTDARAWTVFDPNLRIDTYTGEHGCIVTITHLPSGMQESEGRTTSEVINRGKAMARLKIRAQDWTPAGR